MAKDNIWEIINRIEANPSPQRILEIIRFEVGANLSIEEASDLVTKVTKQFAPQVGDPSIKSAIRKIRKTIRDRKNRKPDSYNGTDLRQRRRMDGVDFATGKRLVNRDLPANEQIDTSKYKQAKAAQDREAGSLPKKKQHRQEVKPSQKIVAATSEAIITASEGERQTIEINVGERDPKLSKMVKELNRNRHGGVIVCESCGFESADPSVFDAHHLHPIAAGIRATRIDDLAVLCPTCHRLSHRKSADPMRPIPVDKIKLYR